MDRPRQRRLRIPGKVIIDNQTEEGVRSLIGVGKIGSKTEGEGLREPSLQVAFTYRMS